MEAITDKIKLKAAYEIFKEVEKRTDRTYESFRKSVNRYGCIKINDREIEASKIGGTWYLDVSKFREEIKNYKNHNLHIEKVTDDYSKGVLHGSDDEIITTNWGGYRLKGQYRYVWNDYERYRKKRGGYWMCNKCSKVVETYGKCKSCEA